MLGVVVVLVGALVLMGGQTSTILSNVGAPIMTSEAIPATQPGMVEDAPVDDGQQVADAAACGRAAGAADHPDRASSRSRWRT